MNWKMKIALHWKTVYATLLFLLVAIAIVSGQVLAEPVDNPGFP